MYQTYKDQVQFFIVYIKEAHPSDDWAAEVETSKLRWIKDPTNTFERYQVANTCVADLNLTIPCLIDDMENTTARAYKGWPDRLFLVGKNGTIAYSGGPGPGGLSVGFYSPRASAPDGNGRVVAFVHADYLTPGVPACRLS